MDLTIGLVNNNSYSSLEGCLRSLLDQNTRYAFEIIVIDNASRDKSIDWLCHNYPQLKIYKNRVNVGTAYARNQAIKAGTGRYIFLLNTDTILLPGTIDRLISFMDNHPDAAAAGGKLLFNDGTFQASYQSFPTLWIEFLAVTRLGLLFNSRFPSNPDCNDEQKVDWIESASLVVRRTALEDVGFIDEDFFIYGDETDLQYRLKMQGWAIYFLPDVKTIHFGGRSLDRWRRRHMVYRGKIIYFRKNLGILKAFVLRLIFFITAILKLILWCILWLVPKFRQRAANELRSNLEILRLCLRSYVNIKQEFRHVFLANKVVLSTDKTESISVIIPTFNRAEMVALTLPSYLGSSLVKEVWLIDDGSNAANWERLNEIAKQDPRVHLIKNDTNIGAPASRNRGIKLATCDLILFSEDDLELGEGQLETLVEHMSKSGADIIAGRRVWMRIGESKEQALIRSSRLHKPVVDFRWLDHYSNAISEDDCAVPLVDATMLVGKPVIDKIRYFEPFGGSSTWREDSDFQIQALRQGFKIVFCPHVCSFHHPRASASFGSNRIKGNLNYLKRVYRNNLLFLERHHDFLQGTYPNSIIVRNPRLTSLLYALRRSIWLMRSESLRWYLSRNQNVFNWK